jgi:hypothetical protein
MSFADRIGYALATKPAKPVIQAQEKNLSNPDYNHQALGHYLLWTIYDSEASRFFPLGVYYRCLAEYHLDQAILRATSLPGPLGARAQNQIANGEFREGIENLETEITRLNSWIEESKTITEANTVEQQLQLAECMKRGGLAYGMIGQFEKGRELLSAALLAFRSFPPEIRIEKSEVEEQIVLAIAWFFQMENKYAEALALIDEELKGFSFSLFPTSVHDRLKSARVMLVEYAPLTATFKATDSVQEIMADLMDKVQRCDTAESILRLRKDVIFALEKQVFDLKISAIAAAAILSIEKQIEVAKEILERKKPEPPPVKIVKIRSAEELAAISDPKLREVLRGWDETTKKTQDALLAIGRLMKKHNENFFKITEYLNNETIKEIKKFEHRIYQIPLSNRIEWASLMLARKGIQFVLIAVLIEKGLETILKRNVEQVIEHFKLHPSVLIVESAIILAIFLIGGFAEKIIDEKSAKRYKRSLILLVMNRSKSLWTTYNALTKVAGDAQDKLRELEALSKMPPGLPSSVVSS